LMALPAGIRGSAAKKAATDRIALGPKRVTLSRLAMGTGTRGVNGASDQTRALGVQGLADLLRAAYEQGLNFWDSADQYGSHPHLKEALKSVPREKVVILSKTRAAMAEQMRADLDRYRRELGTDYIDILLIHGRTDGNWPEENKGTMEAISEAAAKGIVRTHGISSHSLDALRAAARTPWAEVVLARINVAGMIMDAEPGTVVPVLREIKSAGKGVIGMKALGRGGLRDRADECLQYVLGLDCVDCFTIGCMNRQEMEDLVRRIPAASARA